MSLHILDTDIASLFREGHPEVTRRVLAHPPSELAVTVITVEEMLAGWFQKLRQKNTPERLEAIYGQMTRTVVYLGRFNVLSYTVATHTRYLQLDAMKLNVRPFDLRIAAMAVEANGTIVTRNRRDFERVPGLIVEDWSTRDAERPSPPSP